MEVILKNDRVIVCVKPAGVLSTDEPGGMPQLVREYLGEGAEVRTVHRLDRVVGGLMLLALDREAAAELGEQIADRSFDKEYLAVVHGTPAEVSGSFTDYLARDRSRRMTFVAPGPSKEAREAVLDYEVLESADNLSLVRVKLRTGRTHQIRVQFSSRALPLWGDRKYGRTEDDGEIALWSCRLAFNVPGTEKREDIFLPPLDKYPWNIFGTINSTKVQNNEKNM